jgi:hypothetical protein
LSYGNGEYDCWLIKTDSEGNEEWNKTFGGPIEDIAKYVQDTSDGGFLIVGYSEYDVRATTDVWLLKTDGDGNIIWENKYRPPVPLGFGQYGIELIDGYLIMAAIYDSFDSNIWVIKTDFNGNEIWNKTVGGSAGDDNSRGTIIQTHEGDFVIVGGTHDTNQTEKSFLIKIDSNGNRLWRRTYDGDEGFNVFETEDGGYMIISGCGSKANLIKTDRDGHELWRKNYWKWGPYWCWSSKQTSDGGYIIAGSTQQPDRAFIIKTDADGNKFWEFYIGGDDRDSITCAIESNDGNYVFIGETGSFGAGAWDLWMIKMSPFGNIRPIIPNKPIGPINGRIEEEYDFSTNSYDPDGDELYYYWDWDDGYYYQVFGPYQNNFTCIASNTWTDVANFDIKVKAVDIYGGESDWSEPLGISISRSIDKHRSFFIKFLLSFF